MKTFLELLDTQFDIIIEIKIKLSKQQQIRLAVNDKVEVDNMFDQSFSWQGSIDLISPVSIIIDHHDAYVESLEFDGWQARPQWGIELPHQWVFNTSGLSFYQWKHSATGQGWLLKPQLTQVL
jgi:hypothetical protein